MSVEVTALSKLYGYKKMDNVMCMYYIPIGIYESDEELREDVSSLICQSEMTKYGRMHWVITQDMDSKYIIVRPAFIIEKNVIVDCSIEEFNKSGRYQTMFDLNGGLLSKKETTEFGSVMYVLRLEEDRVLVNTASFDWDSYYY